MKLANPRSDTGRAVRFIYLSKTAFNGIYRVNRDGVFNVPFSGQVSRKLCEPELIRDAATSLQGCRLLVRDFADSLSAAGANDLVYCDPPYTVLHNNNGFLRYNESLFSWSDQQRLAELAKAAVSRGACVIVSNADNRYVRRLYRGFCAITVHRTSCVSGLTDSRGRVSELMFIGRPN